VPAIDDTLNASKLKLEAFLFDCDPFQRRHPPTTFARGNIYRWSWGVVVLSFLVLVWNLYLDELTNIIILDKLYISVFLIERFDMALYELILRQQTNAQMLINRWNYVSQGSPVGVTGSFALVSAAGAIADGDPLSFPVGGMFASIQALQANDVIFVEFMALNVYDLDDFYSIAYPTGLFGGVAQAGASLFVAAGFRTNRVTRAVRRGTKRFGGVPIGSIGEFGGLTAGYLTTMATCAAEMSATLEYTDGGNSLSFEPTIVSKQLITPVTNPRRYQYYPTLAEQLEHVAQGITWEAYTNTRSQNSRQLGRGA
jgi:hypothetical protein